MARRIAVNTLNASTMDIMNVIRQNASYEYQQSVPVVAQASDIPRVGEVIYGTPAFANQFINALVNRIALVRAQSATFNNPYSVLKKGYLEFGETVEDIFVNIAKVVEYDPEKAPAREFKRTLPDVRSAFHVMNWRVMYPVTIQDEDLKRAFLSIDGVTDLINKIVESVYTAAEYDEFLLFKYLLIKAISHGQMHPITIGDGTNLKTGASKYRGISNLLPFMKSDYNEAGVKTTTPKERQIIFMDAMYNAEFDVEVLASSFNMDKAEFMGRLFIIDDWTTFDNERFEVIRANSDGLEEVTATELAQLAYVKSVVVDENWFQVYDNNNKFTENYVASGLYWNYFYHTWKTISHSPFANAIVFATTSATTALPNTFTAEIESKDIAENATVLTIHVDDDAVSMVGGQINFVQTADATEDGIAIHKFGAVILPPAGGEVVLTAMINGEEYISASNATGSYVADTIDETADVGATFTMVKKSLVTA